LLRRTHTPGIVSDISRVRIPAQILHITKVTLLRNFMNFLPFLLPVSAILSAKAYYRSHPIIMISLSFFATLPLVITWYISFREIVSVACEKQKLLSRIGFCVFELLVSTTRAVLYYTKLI